MADKGLLLLFAVGVVVIASAGIVFMDSSGGVQPESEASAQQTTTQAYQYGVEYHPDDPGERVETIDYKTVNMNQSRDVTLNTTRIERAIFKEINEIRSENGLSEWEYSYRLASVSRSHSADMAEKDYLKHANEDGQQPWHRWEEMEYERCLNPYGENIVQVTVTPLSGDLTANETTAQSMVDAWMGSTGHRNLILSERPTYNYIGVGVYFVGDEGDPPVYGTMDVCGPEDPDAPFESDTAS